MRLDKLWYEESWAGIHGKDLVWREGEGWGVSGVGEPVTEKHTRLDEMMSYNVSRVGGW